MPRHTTTDVFVDGMCGSDPVGPIYEEAFAGLNIMTPSSTRVWRGGFIALRNLSNAVCHGEASSFMVAALYLAVQYVIGCHRAQKCFDHQADVCILHIHPHALIRSVHRWSRIEHARVTGISEIDKVHRLKNAHEGAKWRVANAEVDFSARTPPGQQSS